MKILKSLGIGIGIYIVLMVLKAVFIPNAVKGIDVLINITLICVFLFAVIIMVLGGKGRVLTGIPKTILLVFGLAIMTVIISFMTGRHGEDVAATLIKEVVPFGNIIGSLLGVIKQSAMYESPLPIDFAVGSAKLLLEAILYPIITGFLFVLVFTDREAYESDGAYAKRSASLFRTPDPAFDRRKRVFSVPGAISSFFGAVYSAYAATFVFNGLVNIVIKNTGINQTIVYVILFVIIIGLLLLVWLSPILRPDKALVSGLAISQGRGVLMKLLFSLIKMTVYNIVIVLIAGLFSGTVI